MTKKKRGKYDSFCIDNVLKILKDKHKAQKKEKKKNKK